MKPADMGVFVLVTKAQELAAELAHSGMAGNAEVIRELCRRVVPTKIVPSGGSHPRKFVADPGPLVPIKDGLTWCDQCDKRVQRGCQSKFCKVAA